MRLGAALLGLPDERCFTDPAAAFSAVEADFCTVVVAPAFHEAVIDAAVAHGLDILCEKPIADTMAGSLRVAGKVAEAGRDDEPPLRPGQDDAALARPLGLSLARSTRSAAATSPTCTATWPGAPCSVTRWTTP